MIPWLKDLVLPPTPLLAVGLAALAWSTRRRDAGWWGAVAVLVALYALSTPLLSTMLLSRLEVFQPLTETQVRRSGARAIVVLSAEKSWAPEYGGMSVGPLTLVRLRYAARVERETHLPLLVSGGRLDGGPPIADAMQAVLKDDFRVPVAWIEDRSRNTWENARDTAAILKRHGIGRILLVTHAWHMKRAVYAFRRAGIAVVPAPTGFTRPAIFSFRALIPSARALVSSYFALYEELGGLYYHLAKS